MDLKKHIRDIPDFPVKGILFHDVTTLFKNPVVMDFIYTCFCDYFKDAKPDYVAGIEARGFIPGAVLAEKFKCGFIPVRKPGKLPADIISKEYELEYGTNKIEIHRDALEPGKKVLLIDDLVATGGTLVAAISLVEKLGGTVCGVATIIDMPDLGGREKLKNYNYYYLVEYSGH